MAVLIEVPMDPLVLEELVVSGFTSLSLWVSDTPDGVYADSGVTASPATLAASLLAEDYVFTFSYSGGSPAQWYKVRAQQGVTYSDSFLSSPFPGGSGVSLRYLRRRLGQMLNDMYVFTATSGGTVTTVNSTNFAVRRWPDNFFNEAFLYRVATKEQSVITSSTQAGLITFAPANAISTPNGAEFEVTMRWTKDDYVNAINWACVHSYPTLSRPIINTGVQTVDDSYLYTAPQDIIALSEVQVESSRNPTSLDQAIRGYPWTAVRTFPVYDGQTLKFELDTREVKDRRMRISGTGYLSQMSDDTDTTECQLHNAELLLIKAAERLYMLHMNTAASSDRDMYGEMANIYRGQFEEGRTAKRSRRTRARFWGPASSSSTSDRYNSWRYA